MYISNMDGWQVKIYPGVRGLIPFPCLRQTVKKMCFAATVKTGERGMSIGFGVQSSGFKVPVLKFGFRDHF
jgi:hypothetical protein